MMQKPLNPDISGFKVLVASYESTWEVIQVIKIELKMRIDKICKLPRDLLPF